MLLLRRACSSQRVPASLTSSMSGKNIHSHYLRQLHTATGRNTGNTSSWNVFALAVGSVALGLGGYYVGTRRAIESSPPKPVYGAPEDFASAIEELKTLFSKDTVTTDEGQLEAHGFSSDSYHPGIPCHRLRH
jgi:D-lactate dehydrogenase (cytochrome)